MARMSGHYVKRVSRIVALGVLSGLGEAGAIAARASRRLRLRAPRDLLLGAKIAIVTVSDFFEAA